VGVREVQRLGGQAGDADARGGRGDEHWQDLQGGLSKGDPLAGEWAVWPGLRARLPPETARRTPAAAQRAEQRAAVDHVRSAAQGRDGGRAEPQDAPQAVVHPADEGIGGPGGTVAGAQGQTPARRAPGPGQKGRLRRPLPGPVAGGGRGAPARAAAEARGDGSLGRPAGQRRRKSRVLLLDL